MVYAFQRLMKMPAPSPDLLIVRRAPAPSYSDLFAPPAGAERVALRRSHDGSRPRLATEVRLWWDDQRLNIVFSGVDDALTATYRQRDEPLYLEDVVEVFLSPEDLTRYFEFEVNPLGAVFDARVHSPDGNRFTMNVDPSWDCADLFSAVRRRHGSDRESFQFDALLAIPFASLERPVPTPGERWRANFFRIDRSESANEFCAWQPTGKYPADFHVTDVFGTLEFQD